MEYLLQGLDCSLRISNIRYFAADSRLPSNTLCMVMVVSGNFRGAAEFDLAMRQLGQFACQLKSMYETLDGTAVLEEAYASSHIKIAAIGKGHFSVSGTVGLPYPKNMLAFEFEIDQTMLKDFATALYQDFSKFK